MYIYIYIYTFIYIYTHIHVYIYISIHSYTYIHTYMYIYILYILETCINYESYFLLESLFWWSPRPAFSAGAFTLGSSNAESPANLVPVPPATGDPEKIEGVVYLLKMVIFNSYVKLPKGSGKSWQVMIWILAPPGDWSWLIAKPTCAMRRTREQPTGMAGRLTWLPNGMTLPQPWQKWLVIWNRSYFELLTPLKTPEKSLD